MSETRGRGRCSSGAMSEARRGTRNESSVRRRLRGVVAPLLLVAAVGACAHAPDYLKMPEPNLLALAQKAYKAHKWDDAIQAYQQYTFRFPTAKNVERARYMLAMSYFGKKEYVTAANEFDRLATDYPSGNYADDARFKVCESYERLSPKVALDQKYTHSAIEHCQSLLTYYPDSPYADSAKSIIKSMRAKLARKMYVDGQYYHKRGAYDSAIVYYDDLLKNYPDTPSAPQALLAEMRAYEKIGYKEEAQTARARLLKQYPNSPAAKSLGGGGPTTVSKRP